jgi:hypothetical protein
VAEKLGRNDIALNHYQAAVDIEDAYRTQFRIMYPERKTVISRLGNASVKPLSAVLVMRIILKPNPESKRCWGNKRAIRQ